MGDRFLASVSLVALISGCGASVETGPSESNDAGGDVAVARPKSVDIVGTWHVCSERLSIAADGTWKNDRLREACNESGHYQLDGEVLDSFVDQSTCTKPSQTTTGIVVVRTESRLHFIHATFSKAYFADSVPHTRYRFTGKGVKPQANGNSIVRVVAENGNGASACYWSEDGACGGAFSCGGVVDWWSLTGSDFKARFGCTGDCPCATILTGTDSGGPISGSFDGLDCQGPYDGTFDATVLPDD
jgi:hypothetical protein